ncbi:MAG: hypothetical protein RL038_1297, partial [Actinomycetota bacterium]
MIKFRWAKSGWAVTALALITGGAGLL